MVGCQEEYKYNSNVNLSEFNRRAVHCICLSTSNLLSAGGTNFSSLYWHSILLVWLGLLVSFSSVSLFPIYHICHKLRFPYFLQITTDFKE